MSDAIPTHRKVRDEWGTRHYCAVGGWPTLGLIDMEPRDLREPLFRRMHILSHSRHDGSLVEAAQVQVARRGQAIVEFADGALTARDTFQKFYE